MLAHHHFTHQCTSRQRRPRSLRACGPVIKRQLVVPPRAQKPEEQASVDPESDFDKETAHLALRMLTARAAGMVLRNISHVDTFQATWMEEYFSKHPPIEGNVFLAGLFETRPMYSVDPQSGTKRYINPAAIATAVLTTRQALAQQLVKTLPTKVHDDNVTIMRTHLETHTYVSGTNEEVKPTFRLKAQDKKPHQLQQ